MRSTPTVAEAIARMEREGRIISQRPTPALADETSEREFQAAIIALAKRHGWLVYHTHDSRKSVSGFPDLVLLRGSVLIVAELKTVTGTAAAAQLTWLEAFRSAGVQAYLWRPADWPTISGILQAAPA